MVLAQTLRRRVTPRLLRWELADRRVPVGACWGFDRRLPVGRHYIESFLVRFDSQEGNAGGDLHGRVLENLHGALKPGGVLLLTGPGITSALTPDRDHGGDWWRFTSSSLRRLLEDAFPGGRVHAEAYGNLQSATFFLHGAVFAGDPSAQGLDLRDPDYQVTIAARVVKAHDGVR